MRLNDPRPAPTAPGRDRSPAPGAGSSVPAVAARPGSRLPAHAIEMAPAKVNLALEVVGVRSDGYHDLVTVMVAVDWADTVDVEVVESPAAATLTVTGPRAGDVPADAGNLCVAAAEALLAEVARTVVTPVGLSVRLDKHIPVAAGMGGGSSDAAAVLRAGARLFAARGLVVPAPVLAGIAASLGSDVPAALTGGAVLARGRGDLVEPLDRPDLHLAVAVAGPSATGATYAALTAADLGVDGRADRVATALRAGGPVAAADCGSALEPAARRVSPALAASLDRLRSTAPDHAWHLTGSGGAAFVLAASPTEAAALAAAAAAAGFEARACRTVAAPGTPVR